MICFYQNYYDLLCFVQYIQSLGAIILSPNGDNVDIFKSDEDYSLKLYRIVLKGEEDIDKTFNDRRRSFIEFTTVFPSFMGLQCGKISIYKGIQDDSKELKIFYNKIIKYIKKNYLLSDNKGFYVAPNFYKDYIAYRVTIVPFVKRKFIEKIWDPLSFDAFISLILNKGYVIEEYGKDVRDRRQENIDLNAEGYVLYTLGANLDTIVRARKKYFSANSECIFLFVEKSKNTCQYCFYMDDRLVDGKHSDLECLFDIINNYT